MTIAIDTSASGAITTYTDLVTELRDLQDNAAYDTAAIERAVRKAESYFLRKLRLHEQEVTTSLAVNSATASLPDDCRELRSVIWLGTGRNYPLNRMSLSGLAETYGGQTGAHALAYAQEGSGLRFAPVVSGTVRIVYFANLSPLSDANPTNWLFEVAPDLYIAGAQYYLCRRERDDEGAAMAIREADGIIQSLQDESLRYGGNDLTPTGMPQVFGSRV